MQQININDLKPHPRNNDFFDDMSDEKWAEFLESIKTSGVIEPIVVTTDMVIVSGHQRVRACKELGINTISCEIKPYKDEDAIIKDLLETNIRQRGDVGGSAKKVGLRIKELERLYGVQHGGERGNQYVEAKPNNSVLATQSDIASQMGISVDTLQNYKLLSEMIPELENLFDTGIVTKTTALAIIKELSVEEQEELISGLDTTKKITGAQMQKYIDKIKELRENPPLPEDYEDNKTLLKEYKKENARLIAENKEKIGELQKVRKEIQKMKEDNPEEQYKKKVLDSFIIFNSRISQFIEDVGGYIWLADKINELSDDDRKGYLLSIQRIREWVDAIEYNINKNKGDILS